RRWASHGQIFSARRLQRQRREKLGGTPPNPRQGLRPWTPLPTLHMRFHRQQYLEEALLAHGFYLRIQLVHADYITCWILSTEPSPGSHIRHLCKHIYTLCFPLLQGLVDVLNLKIELDSSLLGRYSWWKRR